PATRGRRARRGSQEALALPPAPPANPLPTQATPPTTGVRAIPGPAALGPAGTSAAPNALGAAGAPASPVTAGTPGDPNTQGGTGFPAGAGAVGTPGDPNTQGGTGFPAAPGTPLPGASGAPADPRTPGAHGGNGYPTAPGGPATPDAAPGDPNTPGTHSGNGYPAAPGGTMVPGTPGAPNTPGTPDGNAFPAAPGAPVPGAVALSAGPGAAGAPGSANTPGTHGGNAFPAAPGVPAPGATAGPADPRTPATHGGNTFPAAPVPNPAAAAEGADAPPTGRRRRALAGAQEGARAAFALPPADADRRDGDEGRHDAVRGEPDEDHTPPQPHPLPAATRAVEETRTGSVPLPPALPMPPAPAVAQPLPAEAPTGETAQGRAFSVRTLGQGVPFAQQIAAQQNATGRRRRLATPPEDDRPLPLPTAEAKPHPQPVPSKLTPPAEGRAYAIGAPDEDADEGPEPLDGPGGAVEVSNQPAPQPVDDELPPEPLDNPRRLLVWPAPDVSTQQALSDRGYRPVIVHSREEVDAQIAAFPAALFVDPLTGPITRTALQSLRQAAVAAEVPVLLAAGLGQATREAAYGADPAVLLKALAPRDSEQHPSRVLLIEEHDDIAHALTATLERRGMQVARASADTDAVTLATQTRPNLVVMDLMQVRRRRAGIIDWLRANGQLNRTPLVVYTSAGLDEEELPKLSSGETVLFLAERSTSDEVQARIVDLLAKIGTN
ncbi:MAG TPA: hypothetical protein VIU94_25225, partial [Streptomyces sp.]